MKFNVYGRFVIHIRRESDSWVAYREQLGKRRKLHELIIPSDLRAEKFATYLDDAYHEPNSIDVRLLTLSARSGQPQ